MAVRTNFHREITFMKALSAAQAILTARKVSDEICQERSKICGVCQFKHVDKHGIPYCGQCGCQVSSNDTAILNLCRYEENLPKWGCKHPQREIGGWKR